MYCMSPMYHRNTRNPHMVAEQEFRTTTQNQPASPDDSTVEPLAQVMVASEQIPSQSAAQRRAPCCCAHEMLENDTLVAPFGKEDAAAHSQSHAARTQETLVNAVENAEVTEIIRAVFCAFDTSQELQRRRNPTRLPRFGTQSTSENNETFRHETLSHESKTALVAGAHDEEERQGCQESWCGERSSETPSVAPCLLPHKQTSRSTLSSCQH